MSRIGLEKILEMMLVRDFPGIGRPTVIPTSDDIVVLVEDTLKTMGITNRLAFYWN